MSNDTRAEEIRERLDAATPGPWTRFGWLIAKPEVDIVQWAYVDMPPAEWTDDEDSPAARTLEFIAHAPVDVAWLLADRDRLTEQLSELQAALSAQSGASPDVRGGKQWGWVCADECQAVQGYGHHVGCEYRDPVAEVERLRALSEEACGICGGRKEVRQRGWTDEGEWHVVEGGHLLELLRRAAAGEDADLLFAELWANADHERIEP